MVLRTTCEGRQIVSPNYWKLLVPEPLLYLPRFEEVMRGVMADLDIRLSFLPSNLLASKILAQAHAVLQGLPGKCCFKIGPLHRWQNPAFGYKHSRNPLWHIMKLLGVVAHGESAGFLEAALISAWASHPSCLNEAGGGEAISKQEGPFFVYVVVSKIP